MPSTGIVDYTIVAQKYAGLIRQAGGELVLGAKVVALRDDGATNVPQRDDRRRRIELAREGPRRMSV